MEATLTKSEIETLSKSILELIFEKIKSEAIITKLTEACATRTQQIISVYLAENNLNFDVQKVVAPILEKVLRESSVVSETLNKYMSSVDFKQLEISKLRNRIWQLEKEIEEYDRNN